MDDQTMLYGIKDTITGMYYKGGGAWGSIDEAAKKSKNTIRAMIGGLRNGTKNPLVRISLSEKK